MAKPGYSGTCGGVSYEAHLLPDTCCQTALATAGRFARTEDSCDDLAVVVGQLLREPVHDRSLAVAMTAKTRTVPCGGEIRVVHAPTGEVIFRKHND
jgi:hypothetical protein